MSALGWSQLPERIPIHFDMRGDPDAWARTSLVSWFALPVLSAVMAVFFQWIGRLAARSPDMWNVPAKDEFLRLPPSARQPIIDSLERMLGVYAVLTTIIFMAVQFGMYLTATGRSDGLPAYVEAVVFGVIIGMLVLAFAWNRRLKRRILSAAAAADR